MGAAEVLSYVAVFVSIGALIVAILMPRWQVKQQAWLINQQLHSQLATMYREQPSLLRFSGIDPDELNSYGLTPGDLAYLIANIEVGDVYYSQTEPHCTEPFPVGTHRYKLCTSPAFRRAWPLLEKLYPSTNYIERYRRTMSLDADGGQDKTKLPKHPL